MNVLDLGQTLTEHYFFKNCQPLLLSETVGLKYHSK